MVICQSELLKLFLIKWLLQYCFMVVRCGDGNTVIKLKTYNFTSTSEYYVLAHTLRILLLQASLVYTPSQWYIIYYKRCVKYWLKIFKMSGHRLPHACYGMLKGVYDCNRVTWASNIKKILCKFGFEYVWNAQGVQDENALLCVLEDRLKQHFVTLWRKEILNSRKLSTYSMFKT